MCGVCKMGAVYLLMSLSRRQALVKASVANLLFWQEIGDACLM